MQVQCSNGIRTQPTEIESHTLELEAINDTYILDVRDIDES